MSKEIYHGLTQHDLHQKIGQYVYSGKHVETDEDIEAEKCLVRDVSGWKLLISKAYWEDFREMESPKFIESTPIEDLIHIYEDMLEPRLFDRENEMALLSLMKAYKKDLPDPLNKGCFHSAFRKVDVTNNGHVDMAFWHLLMDVKVFWDAINKLNGSK